ncbi:tetratricopeptide repeat protein [Brevibacillus sp. HD1.4A]|uniref:tetratricopeptide repeat protein n=1 Tax=Brevibacillus sp. HD1.4A TaxID=2738978 RepID=UPI00156BB8DB|nr:tetratricopeptide repeat protein [Brevibacillus sp. HD1.4A]NRQ54502.1 tetratricopeptide repeat protein [Brevibacillus sp. HD1.4A]
MTNKNNGKILRRVKLKKDDEIISIMTLSETPDSFEVTFSRDTSPEHLMIFEEIIKKIKERGQYEDPLVYWENVLSSLDQEHISIIEFPIQTKEVQFKLDMDTGTILTSYADNSAGDNNSSELLRSIAGRIKHVFTDYGKETVLEIETALQKDNQDEAYQLLVKGQEKGILQLGSKNNKTKLLHIINKILPTRLDPIQQKNLYEIKFLLAHDTGLFSVIFDDVSKYIENFANDAEPGFITTLLLAKANAASQLGKRELAYSLYQQVLREGKNDPSNSAWAHRGLAITLGYDDPDGCYHERLAADLFLLSGNKNQFARSKAIIAESIKTNEPDKALILLDEAINIFDVDDPFQKDKIAALLLNKAKLLHLIGQNELAFEAANRSFELRNGSKEIGNEVKTIASLKAAIQFAEESKMDNALLSLKDQYESLLHHLEQSILEEDKSSYELRKRLCDALSNKDLSELVNMKDAVLGQTEPEITASYWISYLLVNTTAGFQEKLEWLESAWYEANKIKVENELKAAVCSLFAEVYHEEKEDEKAIDWYKRALEFNPFSFHCRQNYAALLWSLEKWKQAVIFFEEQLSRFGELPGLLFAYGKSLVEAGEPSKAIYFLRKAQKENPQAKYIQEYLSKAIDNLGSDVAVIPRDPKADSLPETVTVEKLEKCFADFIQFVQSDKRMSFWKFDQENKRHKWVSSPEQHGQNLLHTFIKSRFGYYVEAIEEVSTGAGRIDIYLHFQNGIRTVVELKMCGGGYSETYALDGLKQLAHYLENKNTHLGYLIVFDGRLRDTGKGILAQYPYKQFTIRSYIADIRPEVK